MLEAAYHVAQNLREEDRREVVEGHGVEPTIAIPLNSLRGFCVYFTVPDGRIAGLAGIEDDGRVWMLCTPAILDFPLTLQGKQNVLLTAERKVYCGTMLTSATLFTSNYSNSLGSTS